MSPHVSGESVLANRMQTQQHLPAAKFGGGVTKQIVPYIVLHMACRVSQQLEKEK